MKSLSQKSYLNMILLGLVGILVITIIILSCVPPVSRDALTHHLAVPKLYIDHGGIYEIPTLKFSYYPMNLDLLYMVPLYFGNDIIPKFIHFVFSLLTAWFIFDYLGRRIGTAYGLAGGLFFLSLPVIVKLSITVYVDLGLIFFSTWALISLLSWLEKDFKLRFLVISAVSCGLALGTKYNGLVTFFLLSLFVPYIFAKYYRGVTADEDLKIPGGKSRANRQKKSPVLRILLYGAVFAAIALIVFSPWMIRNYLWTDNPVYPLYNGWFGSESVNPMQSGSGLRHFEVRRIVFKESLWQTLLIPVRIFFEGQDDLPQYFDGKLNPFLFFLPFFAFLGFKKNTSQMGADKKILLAFAVLYLLFTFFKTDMRIRYVAPIIPPLVILSMYGLYQINAFIAGRVSVSVRKCMPVGVTAVVVLMFGMNTAYILGQFDYVEPLSYLSGRLDRDAYIQKYRPEYTAIKYANENLQNQAKILCVFLGSRRYYSEKEMVFGDAFFRNTVMKAQAPENISADLKEQNITHMLIRYDMFDHFINQQLDAGSQMILGNFFKNHTHRLFSKAGYRLFKL